MTAPVTPPGWYPDPGAPGQMRWWDGHIWTPHTTGTTQRTPGSPLGPYRSELRMAPWARVAAVIYAAGSILNAVLALRDALRWHHWWHAVWEIIQHPPPAGQTVTLPPQPYPTWEYFSLFTLVASVVWVLWQYEAAATAKNLGMPSGCSPGWGVGGWFVPIANFWVPAQAMNGVSVPAIRCAVIWKFWLAYIVDGFVTSFGVIALGVSTGFGIVCLVVSLMLDVVIVAGAWRFVPAVAEDHRLALAQAGWS